MSKKQKVIIISTIFMFIFTWYGFVYTLRNMTYAKVYISNSEITEEYGKDSVVYVSLGDTYTTDDKLAHIIIFKYGKRIDHNKIIMINKESIYRVDNFDSVRIGLKEYVKTTATKLMIKEHLKRATIMSML